jgi:hypothetical protein
MKYGATLTALAVMATATTAVAQDGTIGQSFLATVPLGNVAAFEEAYLRHVDWHRNQNDPWRWDTWHTITGELGMYFIGTDGHNWSDFDSPPVDPAADGADAMEQFGSLVSSITGGFAELLPDVSRPGGTADDMPLAHVIDYKIKVGREADFMAVVRKFNEAAEKANWEQNYVWVANVSGGTAQYVLVLQHANFASMAPPAKNAEAIMEDAFGAQEAEMLIEMLEDIVESWTEQMWQYRPDLSYVPGM